MSSQTRSGRVGLGLLEREALAVGPAQLQRRRVVRARPARLLDVEPRRPCPCAVTWKSVSPEPSQAPDTLPPLFSWWIEHDRDPPPGALAHLVDERHEVADLLQRPGLVHAGAA